jgi:hypothetical protein
MNPWVLLTFFTLSKLAYRPSINCLISLEQSCKSEVIRLVNISQLLIKTLLMLIIHIDLAIEVDAYFRKQDGFTNLGLLALFERFSRSAK